MCVYTKRFFGQSARLYNFNDFYDERRIFLKNIHYVSPQFRYTVRHRTWYSFSNDAGVLDYVCTPSRSSGTRSYITETQVVNNN